MHDSNNNIPQPNSYYTSLDGIRGLGCILVLTIHYHFQYINLPFILAYTALHTFFIMSAYLISRNLLKEKALSKNFFEFFKVFYIKRTARIFPIYFLYLFIVIIIFVLIKLITNQTAFGVISELKRYGWMLFTFTYNLKMQIASNDGLKDYMGCFLFPHLWSVSLEEQFYLVVIFLIWLCNKNTLRFICITLIVIIPIIRICGYYYLTKKNNDDFLTTLTLIHSPYYQFDAFFYGIGMAVFDIKKSKKFLFVFAITLIVILGHAIINSYIFAEKLNISIFTALRDEKFLYKNYGIYFLDITINLFSCAWIYCVIFYPKILSFFANRILVKYGELSYGLYIFQFLALGAGLITTIVFIKFANFSMAIAQIFGFAVYMVVIYWIVIWLRKKVEIPVSKWKGRLLIKYRRSNNR